MKSTRHFLFFMLLFYVYTLSLLRLGVVLLFGLLDELLELSSEILVFGLYKTTFPHAGGGIDEIAKAHVCLCFSIGGFNVFRVFLLGLFAME